MQSVSKCRKKTLVIISVALALLISLGVFAANILYPNAKVVFSGIQIVSNGETTQGFIDVSVKNLNATGIAFCLKYDKSLIKLSNVNTNKAIENSKDGSFNTDQEYFKQNENNFPAGVFQNQPVLDVKDITPNYPHISFADAENGYFSMNFVPKPEGALDDVGDYIGYIDPNGDDDDKYKILANSLEGVNIGTLSFVVLDSDRLSKLSNEQLKNIIKVVPFAEMYDSDTTNIEGDLPEGVSISYVDEDGRFVYVAHKERYVDYELDIQAKLEGVEAQRSEYTVTAYDIYNKRAEGEEQKQDLFDFLNEKATVVNLCYSDGTKKPAKTMWDINTAIVTPEHWDPKGGTYTIKQIYNQDIENSEVTVTVNVKPITLTGLEIDNQTITYIKKSDGTGTNPFPTKASELQLPAEARPVLDTVILNGGISEMVKLSSWSDDNGVIYDGDGGSVDVLPDGFGDSSKVYQITADSLSGVADLCRENPWLTPNVYVSDIEIAVIRNVIADDSFDEEKLPKAINASATTADDGTMTITVTNIDNSAFMDGTGFEIKLPDGELIDTAALETDGRYAVSFSSDKTEAVIVITPDINQEVKLAEAINLGERLGEFRIAAVLDIIVGDATVTTKSPETAFSSNPRRNVYLGPDVDADVYGGENVYLFDYSKSLSATFPVRGDAALPTTITLPDAAHRVVTTYDGYDGYEPGQLATITVDSWVESTADGVGGTVKRLTGRLSDTSYTNYGEVVNPPEAEVYVTIVYYTTAETNKDEISVNPESYTFNKQQVGYGYDRLQTKNFEVKNIGHADIYGLTAEISMANIEGDAVKKAEAFICSKTLPLILKEGETVELGITTKHGLNVGTYTATIQLISNNEVLKTINLSFTVTDEPVFDVKVKSSNTEYGTAGTSDGTATACEGDSITIKAVPKNNDDYEFVEWQTENENLLSEEDAKKAEVTFKMPAENVSITAIFRETVGARLRASELYVLNDEDILSLEEPTNYFMLCDTEWKAKEFEPAEREYNLAVPNNVEKIKLWFKVNNETEAAEATKTVTNTTYIGETAQPDPATETIGSPDVDDYYKSTGQILVIGPAENRVELTFSYTEENGERTDRTYIFHIYRKIVEDGNTSLLANLNYGNSPYGCIMRDETLVGGTDEEEAEKRLEKKTAFVNNGYKFTADYIPQGMKSEIKYNPNAWNDGSAGPKNYDLDDYALFVSQNEVFFDPGYNELKNSIGQNVTDKGLISKTVKVNTLAETDDKLWNGGIDDFTFITANESIDLSDIDAETSLNAKRIRPDVYFIEYVYSDYDGSNIIVRRPLIILYPRGDVDASKLADAKDAKRIRERYKKDRAIADGSKIEGYLLGGNIFKYRIVDANRDGYVNMLDSDKIYGIISDGNQVTDYPKITETDTTRAAMRKGGGTK